MNRQQMFVRLLMLGNMYTERLYKHTKKTRTLPHSDVLFLYLLFLIVVVSSVQSSENFPLPLPSGLLLTVLKVNQNLIFFI